MRTLCLSNLNHPRPASPRKRHGVDGAPTGRIHGDDVQTVVGVGDRPGQGANRRAGDGPVQSGLAERRRRVRRAVGRSRRPAAARQPVGGPDIISAMDAVGLFEEVSGRKLEVKHLSAARCSITARILQPFNASRSSVYALAVGNARDNVIDMALVLAEIPVGMTTLRRFAEQQFSS